MYFEVYEPGGGGRGKTVTDPAGSSICVAATGPRASAQFKFNVAEAGIALEPGKHYEARLQYRLPPARRPHP